MKKLADEAKSSFGAARRVAISLFFGAWGLFSRAATGQLYSWLCMKSCEPPRPLHNLYIGLADYFPAVIFAMVGFWYGRRRRSFRSWSALLVALVVVHPLSWVIIDEIDKHFSPPHEVKWARRPPPARIATIYDSVENRGLPEVVPFNDEQRTYMTELLSAVLRVMDRTSDLGFEEDKILGDGEFFWPKDPSKPVRTSRYYTHENFRVDGITLSFERGDEHSSWKRAGLALQPRNFPRGVYDIGLPERFFDDFQLIKAAQETRDDESIPRPIVFYFSHKTIRDLTLKVETRPDVTSVNARFPSTFHVIEISKGIIPR